MFINHSIEIQAVPGRGRQDASDPIEDGDEGPLVTVRDVLQDEHLEFSSKAMGIVESLITLKFGDQIEEEEEKAKRDIKKGADNKGNGSKDPSPPKKAKKRRTKTARAEA